MIRTSADGIAQVSLEPYALGHISVTARAENTSLPPVTFTARAAGVVVEFRSPNVVGPYAAFWGPCRCTGSLNAVIVPVEHADRVDHTRRNVLHHHVGIESCRRSRV
jgi:hypothetical protein